VLTPAAAGTIVADMVGDGDLVVTTDGRVTTLEVLAAEQRAVASAEQLLAAEHLNPVPDAARQAEMERRERERRPFDEDQVQAIQVATSGARLVSVTGLAGSGKGYASEGMTSLWHGQGRRVIALAVAGNRAQKAAADAGADLALNLNQLQARVENRVLELRADDVLLVDEAGLIDHMRYAALLETVTRTGATLVQIGDEKQLSPVGPGGIWTVTHAMAAEHGNAAELSRVRRARDPREAEAWSQIRHGSVKAGLSWYQDKGRLRLYESRPEQRAGMVAEWWEAKTAYEAGRDQDAEPPVMVVDSSNDERDELNRMAQARRLEAGELGDAALRLTTGRELRAGDLVLFNAIHKPAGADSARWAKRVENGTEGVVVEVNDTRRSAVIELHERGEQRRLDVEADVPVELAYARHIAKGQGMTAHTAEVAISQYTSRNQLYTMVSRSRAGSRIHGLLAEIEELEVESRPTPDDRSERNGIPDGATLWSEAKAELDEVRARRDSEREAVTVNRMDKQVSRPSTKQAIGDGPWADRAEFRTTQRVAWGQRQDKFQPQRRTEMSADRAGEALRRSRPGQRTAVVMPNDRGQQHPTRPVTKQAERAPQAMPARDPVESVGRMHVEWRNTVPALAYYQTAGRLDYAADPAVQAVERLANDPSAAVVVTDHKQELRVRDELARRPELADRVSRQGRLLKADVAYNERQQRREQWIEAKQSAALKARVEPGVVPRAYVVAPDRFATSELTRALSVAAESHLITPAPGPWEREQIDHRAAEIQAGLEARQRAEATRQASEAAHLAYERGPEQSRAHATERVDERIRAPAGREI
jgi:hypothetical protein